MTTFKTLEEAAPSLVKTMAENMAARAELEAAGLTYKQRQRN